MRRLASLLLAFAGFAAQFSAAATVSVQAERRGAAVDIRASAAPNADAETAWSVLTDYENYPGFIPDLLASRVVARRGATVTVEQSGHVRLWLLRIPLHITIEVLEMPPNGLRSRAVAGGVRSMESASGRRGAGPLHRRPEPPLRSSGLPTRSAGSRSRVRNERGHRLQSSA